MKKNDNLKKYRIKSGLSQDEFAEKMGAKQSYVAALETNKNFSVKKAMEMAEILGIDWNLIMSDEDGKGYEKVINNPRTIELPLITVASRASFDYEIFQDDNVVYESAPVYKLSVRGLKKPVLIDIDGDSMTPQLAPGTRVLADEIDPNDWNYITGVVAVSFRNQFVVKRIKENRSIETKSLTLYSDNEKGGSFPVKLEDINAIWKVLEIVKAKVE